MTSDWLIFQFRFQSDGFQADGSKCRQGPRELTVQLQSKTYFVCPNTATVLRASSVTVLSAEMYENLWLVYNKTAFNECDVSLDPNKRRILTCNEPLKLTYSLVKFEENTAELNGITFNGGQTYYFIGMYWKLRSWLIDIIVIDCFIQFSPWLCQSYQMILLYRIWPGVKIIPLALLLTGMTNEKFLLVIAWQCRADRRRD